MDRVSVYAPAKVNLSLDITGKRDDGYHLMDMVMQSVSLCDVLTIEKSDFSLVFTCNTTSVPQDATNLAVKAARAFFSETKTPGGAIIHLEKKIPSGAGMGGGSADAAGVLVGLNALYETGLSQEELCRIGLKLGADVPFCIMGATARVTGIGEVIEPIRDLPSCWFAAVKPAFSISTKEAFARFDSGEAFSRPDTAAMVKAVEACDLAAVGYQMKNVFEETEDLPILTEVKEMLLSCGALGAVMTGSGSVIYGLFEKETAAAAAAEKLKAYGESYVFAPVNYGAKVIAG